MRKMIEREIKTFGDVMVGEKFYFPRGPDRNRGPYTKASDWAYVDDDGYGHLTQHTVVAVGVACESAAAGACRRYGLRLGGMRRAAVRV